MFFRGLLTLGLLAAGLGAGKDDLISKQELQNMLKSIKAAEDAGLLEKPEPQGEANKGKSDLKRANKGQSALKRAINDPSAFKRAITIPRAFKRPPPVASRMGQDEPDMNGSPAQDPINASELQIFMDKIIAHYDQNLTQDQNLTEEERQLRAQQEQQAQQEAVERQEQEQQQAQQETVELLPPEVQQQIALMQSQGVKAKAPMHRGKPQDFVTPLEQKAAPKVDKKSRSSRKMRGSSLVQVNAMGEATKAVVMEDEQGEVLISKAEEEEILRRIKDGEEKHGQVEELKVVPDAPPMRLNMMLAEMEVANKAAKAAPQNFLYPDATPQPAEGANSNIRQDHSVHSQDPRTPEMEKEFLEQVAQAAEAHMTPEQQAEDKIESEGAINNLLPPSDATR